MNEAFRRGACAFPDASAKEQPSRSGQRVPFVDLSSDPHRQIMEKMASNANFLQKSRILSSFSCAPAGFLIDSYRFSTLSLFYHYGHYTYTSHHGMHRVPSAQLYDHTQSEDANVAS